MQDQYGQQYQNFEFTGSGREYFKIWIVNVLLTIITLGIYSAWAKVRRLQYFYRNTRMEGGSFEYHGTPMAILKGRAIAITLAIAYNAAFKINPVIGLVVGLLLALVMPWLLMRSLRFKLYNSSYRGLRFGFAGDTRGAYRVFLLFPMLAALTLYLLAPLAHQRIKQYQFDNARFGSTPFSFSASSGGFYLIYLSSLALMGGTLLLVFALISMVAAGASGAAAMAAAMATAGPLVMLLMLIAMLVVSSLFGAYMQNLVWSSASLGTHNFFSDLSARKLLWVHVTNFLGIVLTLGLYKPFAAVRIMRLKVEAMGLAVGAGLSGFLADQQQQATAAGEEAAEMFDVDISF